MKKKSRRQKRLGDLLRETLAELISQKIKDPRLSLITITDVDITGDLGIAHVYFCMMDQTRVADVTKGLESAEGYLRHELKKELRLRKIPHLVFSYDRSLDYGLKIDGILGRIKGKDG